MKETLLRFNIDFLTESKLPFTLKGQPPLTYPGGCYSGGYDFINLHQAFKCCFKKQDFNFYGHWSKGHDYGMLYTGSRVFGDELLVVDIRVTIQEYDRYLPTDQTYLLEEIKKPETKQRNIWGGHMGGDGGNGSWIYKCAVLNNEVYPCADKKVQGDFCEFFDPVMSVVYERIGAAVREMSVCKLKEYTKEEGYATTEMIINVVSDHFRLNVGDILSKSKNPESTKARKIIMYLCRNMTNKSAENIGKDIGGRDHTTVLHSSKMIDKEMQTDENLRNTIEMLKREVLKIVKKE